MSVKPAAKLRVVLMADDTEVVSIDDPDLWKSLLIRKPLSAEEKAKRMSRRAVVKSSDAQTVKDIMERVQDYFNVKQSTIVGMSRAPTATAPRMVAAWLIRRHTSLSWPSIGEILNRHHTTVIAATARIDELLAEDMMHDLPQAVLHISHYLTAEDERPIQ